MHKQQSFIFICRPAVWVVRYLMETNYLLSFCPFQCPSLLSLWVSQAIFLIGFPLFFSVLVAVLPLSALKQGPWYVCAYKPLITVWCVLRSCILALNGDCHIFLSLWSNFLGDHMNRKHWWSHHGGKYLKKCWIFKSNWLDFENLGTKWIEWKFYGPNLIMG